MRLKSPRLSQPPGYVGRDPSWGASALWPNQDHGITFGAGGAMIAGRSGATISVSPWYNTYRAVLDAKGADKIGDGDFSVLLKFTHRNNTSVDAIVFGRWSLSSTKEWALWTGGTPVVAFSVVCGGTQYDATATVSSWVDDQDYILIGRRRGTTLYVDFINQTTGEIASGSTTNGAITTVDHDPARSLVLGELEGWTWATVDLDVPCAALFPRCLSDQEVKSLLRNPWQLFASARKDVHLDRGFLGTSVVLKSTRTRQPQGMIEIDWGNPITRGLVLAHNQAGLQTYPVIAGLSPQTFYYPSSLTLRKFPTGVAYERAGNMLCALQRLGPVLCAGTSDITFFQLFENIYINSSRNGEFIGSAGQTTAAVTIWPSLGDGTNPNIVKGSIYTQGYSGVGAGTRVFGGTLSVNANATNSVAIRHKYAIEQALFVNGVKDPNTTAHGGTIFTTLYPGQYGAINPTYTMMFWTRALSDGEIAQLHANPWQIFR